MVERGNRDQLVKLELVRKAGISAVGAHQIMEGQVVTDPKDRDALRQYMQLLHLGDSRLITGKCGTKCG